MSGLEDSIIGDPRRWRIPDDVAKREAELREGIIRVRQQGRDEEERRKRVFHEHTVSGLQSLPTGLPARVTDAQNAFGASDGFAED